MGLPEPAAPTPARPPQPARLESVDAYRGLVMLLIVGELLKFAETAAKVPGSAVLAFLGFHQSHVEWVGCSLHDLIQPSFSFLVGVSLPYSLAARQARGQSVLGMSLHAFWRAFVLILLGHVLTSIWTKQPLYGFNDTLSQIGLGYGFLFLLGLRPVRDQWIAFGAILVGYWALFALWPLPGPDYDWSAAKLPAGWLDQHGLTGFAAHWNRHANVATTFDQWFLNLFPRESEFVTNRGGYAVLSFIPTLATMILGLIAGRLLKGGRGPWEKVAWMLAAGAIGLGSGYALGALGVCPVVKRIWTPSWVLFSGGWCFLLLAGFYAVVDVVGWRRWAFPLVVVGMNSIAAYCMSASFIKPRVHEMVGKHLGEETFKVFGPAYATTLQGAATVVALWLILFWMYRRKVFIRV